MVIAAFCNYLHKVFRVLPPVGEKPGKGCVGAVSGSFEATYLLAWHPPGLFFQFETASPPVPIHLSVAIVLFESPLGALQGTLDSLFLGIGKACERGILDRASVFLVDNRSTDAYRRRVTTLVEAMQGSDITLTFLPLPHNKGFGSGHNAVLQTLESDVHLILNPDVELAADALVEGVPALLQREDVALLCPGAAGPSGDPAYLAKRYPSVCVLLLRGFAPAFVKARFTHLLDRYEYRQVCALGESAPVEIASGCFMLIRTSVFRAVAGFDEDFFLYFEDFDLCLRLREQGLGSPLFWPRMRIVHHGGHAARKGFLHLRYFLASGWRFFARHGWRLV